MNDNRQMGLAVGGSVFAHLLLAGCATTLLALQRASPPDNDAFADARPVRGEPVGTSFGDNRYATRQSGEPVHSAAGAGGGSVWWRWRAPERSCPVEVQVVADAFDEVVAIYRGAVVETLSEVASRGEGDGAALSFVAEPGTTYHIAVAGASAPESGDIELRVRADSDAEPEDPEEIVLLLPEQLEFEVVEVVTEEEDIAFARSEGEDLPDAPDDARLQSDRDRAAAGELAPEEEGEEGVGTQDGEDGLPFAPPQLEVTPLWRTDAGPVAGADGFSKVPEIDLPTEQPAPEEEASVPEAEPVPADLPAPAVAAAPEAVPDAALPPAPKARTIGKAEKGLAAASATAETAMGRYQAQIDLSVQASSQAARAAHGAFSGLGFLKVRLWVNREGAVVNTKVLYSDATPEMVQLTLRGLRAAEVPPMPDEVYEAAPDGLVDMVYDVFY